ncbi:flagellin [Bacillus cereus group sp. TH36-2LC]|uniref:flagellin N-terminal helical domain-containing protein n=1 Tax=Bacillus cereus group sp. TH36-2LC TaxID=3018040 RepID=UPI0022E4CBB4|nr:flagellin [Bacillus cereus group sp. TH36-2LC]MDA1508647.1 flagellin [Bacillus cereus group sp. TH36-2LC]
MRINTNINSMRTQEYMRQNQAKMSNAMDRLSSGKRINNASDDAAGLAIATRMRARESGLGVAANNTQDGISLIRTADSALNSVSNILLRMRDIANQSANGTNTSDNQAALQKEFGELQKQIDYISGNTQFNDKNLLDGSNGTINIQTLDSNDSSKQIGINLTNVSTNSLGIDSLKIGNSKTTQETLDSVTDTINKLNTTLSTGALDSSNHTSRVADAKEAFEKIQGTLNHADLQKMQQAFKDYDNAKADKKLETAAAIKTAFSEVKGSVEVTKMSQQDFNELRDALAGTATADDSDHGVKATAAETAYNKFKSYLTKDQQEAIGGAIQGYKTGPATKTLAIAINTAFTTLATPIAVAANQDETTGSANPLTAVKAIDEALKRIADDRANLGATLNRLDFNVNNLKSQSSAMASAASQIEDADMAKEMSEMTKFKILNEAGISMLSQANQTPQMVSKLLQ